MIDKQQKTRVGRVFVCVYNYELTYVLIYKP